MGIKCILWGGYKMNEINKNEIIERLKTIQHNLKIEHMAKDMVDGTSSEEKQEYRADYAALVFAIRVLQSNNFCGECNNFLGCGDWSLCCKLDNGLYYVETASCEKFEERKVK